MPETASDGTSSPKTARVTDDIERSIILLAEEREPSATTFEAFLAPPQSPDEIGRLGSYRVLKLLGEGGMGYVFLAEDEALQRPVALKVMRPEVVVEKNAKERFFREARAAAKVKHDHVVTIHQVGEDRGVPFLALEYLEGLPLDKSLRDNGEVTLRQAVRITREIAAGLFAAHRQSLIHRDIKPANIWLEAPSGRVKILDFGLARHEVEDTQLTRTGEVVGTPAYMSPEQARDQAIDQRSDLFSLGVILYRLCTGRPPFTGSTTMAILTSLAVDDPTLPCDINPAIPAGLQQVIMRLLEKRVERRYQTAQEVVDALNALEFPSNDSDAPSASPARPPSLASQTFIRPREFEHAPLAAATETQMEATPSKTRRMVFAGLFGIAIAFIWIIASKTGDRSDLNDGSKNPGDVADRGRAKTKEARQFTGHTPAPANTPFDARQARVYQDAWARHLGEKVEVENSLGMKLIVIPPGKFLMGSAETEAIAVPNEMPQHEVEISRPFLLGATEVTQEQYERLMKTNPSSSKKDERANGNLPVEHVSWEDAKSFCDELSKQPAEMAAGRVYRLPTEAEWEYACRAGTRSPYFHDPRPVGEFAWYKDNAEETHHPVSKLQSNAWGLHDMTGNVWEWCSDYFDEHYYEQTNGKDPAGPPTGRERVMRGGSFGSASKLCRPGFRSSWLSGIPNNTVGFRVCVTIE